MTITAPIVVSTIGQVIDGPDLIEQTTADASAVQFRTGADDLSPGGAGTYLNGALNAKIKTNGGTALSVGDPAEPTHTGDYWRGEYLFITGAQTAIHFNSMAMGWLRCVLVNNPVDARGAFGFRVTGGSSNSHLWQGVTFGNVGTAVSWETQGCGNVIMPGDVGNATTGFDFYTGAHATIIGGNNEATISGRVLNVRTGATLLALGMGGQGTRTTPAFDANGGYGKILHINTAIGLGSGVMLVTGGGYGTTLALEHGLGADTQFDGNSPQWKELPFPSFLSNAIPDPTSAAIGVGAVIHCIGVGSARHGLLQKTLDPYDSAFKWEWLNSGDFL